MSWRTERSWLWHIYESRGKYHVFWVNFSKMCQKKNLNKNKKIIVFHISIDLFVWNWFKNRQSYKVKLYFFPLAFTVLPNRQPPAQRRPAGCVSVLPALLPAASGVRAACGSAGHLEGSVSTAESERAGIRPTWWTTLPAHRGAGGKPKSNTIITSSELRFDNK